jgi:outer membrane protein OmpA-like peptidoglycan-associated protein
MQGKWGYIGGGAALLFAGIVAIRADLPDRLRGEASPPTTTATPASPAPAPAAETRFAPTTPAALAPDRGEIERLTAALAEREAENSALRTTLAVRDAVIASLRSDLAGRTRAGDDLEARLAAGEAEIARLRREIATLREAGGVAAKSALFEPAAGEPSATRLEAVRVEAADLDAMFAAAKTPGAVPLPVAGVAAVTEAVPRAAATAAVSAAVSEAVSEAVTIHFDFASARLTPGGQIHAAAAAVVIADRTLVRVRLVGHTDRVGSPAANRRLAARRAGTVADFLVEAGVPREMIEIDDRGEADLPVATADGVREPLNRSVEIRILPL